MCSICLYRMGTAPKQHQKYVRLWSTATGGLHRPAKSQPEGPSNCPFLPSCRWRPVCRRALDASLKRLTLRRMLRRSAGSTEAGFQCLIGV